uniref:Uncharacterized protein n=1 Tax=Nelumbo nucifera TaxID=4432 RepID=A0A822YBT4_NELNU|nr:TPA_asm: hypothetical protein HUJ06_030439 [Nelumbo nucifera]
MRTMMVSGLLYTPFMVVFLDRMDRIQSIWYSLGTIFFLFCRGQNETVRRNCAQKKSERYRIYAIFGRYSRLALPDLTFLTKSDFRKLDNSSVLNT